MDETTVSFASSYDKIAKEWIVEVSRPLVTSDTDVEGFGPIDKQFSLDESYRIAFAVGIEAKERLPEYTRQLTGEF
ncbi:hypothetical protein [Nitrosopumilus sp.]|uniref:hypothetical protein n=1 Tax=Nitrosopumilus sp. TaxID=2024843 RepID=UPI003B59B78D